MKNRIIPVVGFWLFGNAVWSIVWFLMVRFGPDETMMWAIGMVGSLVLIVVGIVGIGWYFLSNKIDSTHYLQLETMARVTTAVYFSQKYDVTADELADAITVEEMEERAKRIQSEKQLAELRSLLDEG